MGKETGRPGSPPPHWGSLWTSGHGSSCQAFREACPAFGGAPPAGPGATWELKPLPADGWEAGSSLSAQLGALRVSPRLPPGHSAPKTFPPPPSLLLRKPKCPGPTENIFSSATERSTQKKPLLHTTSLTPPYPQYTATLATRHGISWSHLPFKLHFPEYISKSQTRCVWNQSSPPYCTHPPGHCIGSSVHPAARPEATGDLRDSVTHKHTGALTCMGTSVHTHTQAHTHGRRHAFPRNRPGTANKA